MVNNKDFGKRIQKIMDHYGVSASSFADYMGVGRSSISHILSGRNKPSLDFVMKIVEAYSDIDLQWLLYGKGSFPEVHDDTEIQKKILPSSNTEANLTEKKNSLDQDLFSQSQSTITKVDQTTTPSQENLETIPSLENNVDRIVIFYNDGTFTSYQPKKS